MILVLPFKALVAGGLARDDDGRVQANVALAFGAALERLARRVHALGGTADFLNTRTGTYPAQPSNRRR